MLLIMKMRNSLRSPSFHWMLQSYEKITKRAKYFGALSVICSYFFIHFCHLGHPMYALTII